MVSKKGRENIFYRQFLTADRMVASILAQNAALMSQLSNTCRVYRPSAPACSGANMSYVMLCAYVRAARLMSY